MGCPFCGAQAIFDAGLDINLCYGCGAHETAKGWMSPGGKRLIVFGFKYALVCPLCEGTYNSEADLIGASGLEQALKAVALKHRKCPICRRPLVDQKPKISIFT